MVTSRVWGMSATQNVTFREPRDGEAYAVDADRALLDHIAHYVGGALKVSILPSPLVCSASRRPTPST